MRNIEYDDSGLQALWRDLEPKRRLQVLRKAFRKEATRVQKVAMNNLRASGLRSDKAMMKGVRRMVFKRVAGFRVTIGTVRASQKRPEGLGFHRNRYGNMKPVLIWAEEGTDRRRTRRKLGRKSHSTGRMRRYGFMRKTSSEVRDSVTDNVRESVKYFVVKTAEKYGGKDGA